MANDAGGRDGSRGNRGLFGYEGEGYMRRANDDPDPRDDRGRRGEMGYRGGGYLGGDWQGGEQPGRFRPIDDRDFDRDTVAAGTDYGARPSFRGRGPKGYQRSDERIHEDVCDRLAMDDQVDASDIEVVVNGATVTLGGSVTDRFSKRRAEDIADSVAGVKDVQNQIRIAR